MTRAMQSLGRMTAVAGISVAVGAVLGGLGIFVAYRRRRNAMRFVFDARAIDSLEVGVEAIKMDESPSSFAAGDEVGGDVIGEMSEAIGDADADAAAEIAISGLIENDTANEVAEGNYRAAEGLHTEEMPRNKGPKGKRSPHDVRTRKNLNGHH